ncbi:hypothetical protein EG878_14575 [Enterococcus faecalis]|nr:hypothetical protein EG878_14575 [Enterococcus faecalis]
MSYTTRYLDLVPETTKIDYLQDKIQPYMEFQMPDQQWISFSLGIFYPTTPARTEGKDSIYREIEAYDGLIVLDEDKFTTRYTIAQGTNYKTAIMAILESAGVDDWGLIEDTSLTLARAKEFTPGTPKLDAINELLAAINYTPLWCDAYGYYRASTYVSPAVKQDDYKYIDDDLSVTYAGASEELDLYGVANSWVAVLSNAEQTPLIASKINDNPDSPTSTVNRGRTIVDFREVDDIASQSALNAYVERIAFEASQIFGKVTFETALMPFHEYQDVLYVRYLPLGIEDKYSETGWTMPLKVGGKMKHEVRKVVNI